MFEKLARSAALGGVAASAGAVSVGVGAFALYAVLKEPIGQAGAAGVVALLFLIVALLAIVILRGGGGDKPEQTPVDQAGGGLADLRNRALGLARQRPLLAGAVGVVAALYVLRNPALVSALVGALAGRAEGRYEKRRQGWF